MGEIFLTIAMALFGTLTLGVGGIVLTKKIVKATKTKNANNAVKKLRKELGKDFNNEKRILGIVKNYYKTKIKIVPREQAKNLKFRYYTILGKKRKARKFSLYNENQITPTCAYEYNEKIVYDKKKGLTLNLSDNSIKSDYSKSLVDDYMRALSPTLVSSSPKNHFAFDSFVNRKYKGAVYPLELTITDSTGKTTAFLSDVSANRFYEFAQRTMASLYMNMINSNKQESYKITMNDKAVNTKFGNSQISFVISSPAECKNTCNEMARVMREEYEGFESKWDNINFDKILSIYKHDHKKLNAATNENAKGLGYKESNLESNFINTTLANKIKEFSYKDNNEKRYTTALVFNGQEIISIESKNTDVSVSMIPYLAAYAFVKGYKNHNENNSKNYVQILASEKVLEDDTVNHLPVQKLGDFFDIYKEYSKNAQFLEGVKKIAEENNLVIEDSKLKVSKKMLEKASTVNFEKYDFESSLTTNRPNLKTLFDTDVISQIDAGPTKFSTTITNNVSTKHRINLNLETNSRTVQKNYFFQLMLETYAIGALELKETKKFSPVTIAVDFSKLDSGYGKVPQIKKETFNELEDIKQYIIRYVNYNINSTYNSKNFEKDIKKVKEEYDLSVSNVIIF